MAIAPLVIEFPERAESNEPSVGPSLLSAISTFPMPTEAAGLDRRWMSGVTWQPCPCTALTKTLADVNSPAATVIAPVRVPLAAITQKPFSIQDVFDVNAIEWDYQFDRVDSDMKDRFFDQVSALFTKELVTGTASTGRSLLTDAHAPSERAFNVSATPAFAAISFLENELARKLFGEAGIIHLSPGIFTLVAWRLVQRADGSWWTPRGNRVVADSGMVDASAPTGAAASGANDDWIYATGDIFYQSTEPELLGDLAREWIDISTNKVERILQSFGILVWDPCPVTAILASYNETVF